MTLKQIIRSISFKSLPSLVKLAIAHPLFVIPTLNATRKAMQIAQNEYGNAHRGNTRANAFRHALWNVLIAKKCIKWNNDFEKVLLWTEKITTKHEELAPNKPLPRAMDLHNNKIGLDHCGKLVNLEETEIVEFLKKMAENAQKIEQVADVKNADQNLVYIK